MNHSDNVPVQYRESFGLLEAIYGEGFMSPGGSEEVGLLLREVDLAGRDVLDVGCGVGGADLLLVQQHGARQVIGVDVDAVLLEQATRRAHASGLDGQIEFRLIGAGPLPFADGTFDVVFSKDAILHITDKEGFFVEVSRVLRPGGVFAASDWMRSDDGAPSPALQAYLDTEGLSNGMASMARSCRALEAAGMEIVATLDRNPWYASLARHEIERLTGDMYADLAVSVGAATLDYEIRVWRLMLVVLDSRELCPGHIVARKGPPQ